MPPAPVRVPSQRPLATNDVAVTSVANDKGDNEMILGAVHRSPGIYLTAEENSTACQENMMSYNCLIFFKREKQLLIYGQIIKE